MRGVIICRLCWSTYYSCFFFFFFVCFFVFFFGFFFFFFFFFFAHAYIQGQPNQKAWMHMSCSLVSFRWRTNTSKRFVIELGVYFIFFISCLTIHSFFARYSLTSVVFSLLLLSSFIDFDYLLFLVLLSIFILLSLMYFSCFLASL